MLVVTVAFVLGTLAAILTTLLIHRLGWHLDSESPLSSIVKELELLKRDLSSVTKIVEGLQKRIDVPQQTAPKGESKSGEAAVPMTTQKSGMKKSSGNLVSESFKKGKKEGGRALGKAFDDGLKVGALKVPTPVSGTKAALGFAKGMIGRKDSSTKVEDSFAPDAEPELPEPEEPSKLKKYEIVKAKDGTEIAVWVQTDEEKALLTELKNMLGDEYTNNPKRDYYYDDAALMRFIRARKDNVAAAYSQLQAFVSWCESYGAHDITMNDIGDILRTHQAVFHGFDKNNCPIIICYAAKHISGQFTGEQMLKCIIWSIMTVSKSMRPPVETFTCIIDYDKFSTTKNADLDLVKLMTTTLDPYFPERLGTMININYPWTLSTIWRMVKPWLDPVYELPLDKIIFVSKNDQLQKYIDPANLPKKWGGTSEFQPHDIWCGFEMCSREAWNPEETYSDKKAQQAQ